VDPGCVTVVTRDGSVYYSVRGSTSDVYLATLSTTGETLVAPPSNAGLASVGTSVTPAWSPDGKTLVFLSVSSVNPREASTLNTLNVDTGARRRVTLSEPVPVVGGAYGVAGTGAGLTFLSQLRDTRDGARSFGSIDVGTGEVTRRFSGIYPIELSGDGLRAYRYRSVVDGTSKARVLTVTDLGSQTSQELCRNPEILGGGSRIGVSPDGRSFVSAVSAGTKLPSPVIKVLQVATCTWTEVHRTVEPVDVYDVAWSSDATRIFFSTQDWSDAHKHQLWSIPAAGGKPTLYDVNIGLINRIAVHPDGRRLALDARRNEPRQLWVLERFLPPAKAQAKKRP
jgi:hypothetical protein